MTLSPFSFAYVSDLVRRETAMLYAPEKAYLIEARLRPLAVSAGCRTVDVYVAKMRQDPVEQGRAIDALMINETSWFRDNKPFRALATSILPAMVESRTSSKHLTIWSAACSSGQEPYSMAMVLDEHLPHDWTAEIWATDVSPTMVDRVAAGRYGQVEINRGLPATSLVKYFTRVGSEWEIAPELRAMVRPRVANLVQDLPTMPRFDLVFLRNVLIYFDDDMRREVLDRVRGAMAPDGFLVLGSSETAINPGLGWERETRGGLQIHRPILDRQTSATGAQTLTATGS